VTILVAGATGLAGSAIMRELIKRKESVVGISSRDVNLLDRKATFEYVQDLKPTVIIDAAAKVGGIGGNNAFPVDFLSENIQIQTNLIDAAHTVRVERFVFLGSNCIYPKDCPQPIKEEYILSGALEPTNSAYAIAKLSGMELIKSYRKQYGHKWISLMPINLYGPNDNFDLKSSHVFAALIRKFVDATKNNSDTVTIWGTGKPKRESLHADDFARATLLCLEQYDSDLHINIGMGADISINDLADKISQIVDFKGKIIWDSSKPDGAKEKLLDIQKISNLGWSPLINLEQGIQLTIDWYRQNG
jgi:GDP-L-fucose synthase